MTTIIIVSMYLYATPGVFAQDGIRKQLELPDSTFVKNYRLEVKAGSSRLSCIARGRIENPSDPLPKLPEFPIVSFSEAVAVLFLRSLTTFVIELIWRSRPVMEGHSQEAAGGCGDLEDERIGIRLMFQRFIESI